MYICVLTRAHIGVNCSVETLFSFLGFCHCTSPQESRITTVFDRSELFPGLSEKMGSGYFELESSIPVWKPTSALKMGSYFFPFYSGLTVLPRDN